MPRVGLGCSPYRQGRRVSLDDALEIAIDLGYRLLDTAEVYGTERQIGEALGRPGAPSRSEFFLVSKVWQTNHGFDEVIAAAEASLRRLGVRALELYLVHAPESWPHAAELGDVSRLDPETLRTRVFPPLNRAAPAPAGVPLEETWAAMLELQSRGLAERIGVSNFQRSDLERILEADLAPPMVNQIECYPGKAQRELVRFCQDRGILVMAHSPLSAPRMLQDEAIRTVADLHDKTPAQVVLRWNVQRGVVPIPSSVQRGHLADNLDIFDFELSVDDLRTIDGIRAPGPVDEQETMAGQDRKRTEVHWG